MRYWHRLTTGLIRPAGLIIEHDRCHRLGIAIGCYINTGWDLVANPVGVTAAGFVSSRYRNSGCIRLYDH